MDGIGTFLHKQVVILSLSKEVVKASAGHYPQPFWISVVKNWCKIRREFLERAKNFLNHEEHKEAQHKETQRLMTKFSPFKARFDCGTAP
jgi:hypothetical protein